MGFSPQVVYVKGKRSRFIRHISTYFSTTIHPRIASLMVNSRVPINVTQPSHIIHTKERIFSFEPQVLEDVLKACV